MAFTMFTVLLGLVYVSDDVMQRVGKTNT